MNWPIIVAFLAGGLSAPFTQAAVRWALRKWRERGQSVAIGIDVGEDYTSIATATKHRDGSVHYHVKQAGGDPDWGQALREYWDEIAGRVGAEQAAAFHDALYGPEPGSGR